MQNNTPDGLSYWVVYRNGKRVSDIEHTTAAAAEAEASRWREVISKWPDGSKIVVEEKKRVPKTEAT